jgi:hypothetical protein
MTATELLADIERAFPDGSIEETGGHGWYLLPECPECGKKNHFAFNPEQGYVCHKCKIHGKVGSLINLLRRHGHTIGRKKEVSVPPVCEDVPELEFLPSKGLDTVDVPFPPESRACTLETCPAYFVNRGYPHQLLIEFNFRHCGSGRYGGYTIIPLVTGKNRAWLAYDTHRERGGAKVLDADDSHKSLFLFGYDYVLKKRPKKVVVVEGVTDALRIICHTAAHDYYISPEEPPLPLAILGSKVSEHHVAAIGELTRTLRLSEVIVCLDRDTETDEGDYATGPMAAARKIATRIGPSKVSVATMSIVNYLDGRRTLMDRTLTSKKKLDPDDIKDWGDWRQIVKHRIPLAF